MDHEIQASDENQPSTVCDEVKVIPQHGGWPNVLSLIPVVSSLSGFLGPAPAVTWALVS